MITLEFTLPYGISANAYWRSMRTGKLAGMVLLSREAREYRKAVVVALLEQGVPRRKLAGSLAIDVLVHAPAFRRNGSRSSSVPSDLDNRLKPLLDALTHAGVIEDDHCFDDIHIRRSKEQWPDGGVEIRLQVIRAAAEQGALL